MGIHSQNTFWNMIISKTINSSLSYWFKGFNKIGLLILKDFALRRILLRNMSIFMKMSLKFFFLS